MKNITLAALLAFAASGCAPNQIHRGEIPTAKKPLDTTGCTTFERKAIDLGKDDKEIIRTPQMYGLEKRCAGHAVEVRTPSEKNPVAYRLFFVELDEQGNLYDDRQFDSLRNFLKEALNLHQAPKERQPPRDMSIVTFVHGWRNNADSENHNVRLARQVLDFTWRGESSGPHPNPTDKPREIVGVFIGWRGKSLTIPGLEQVELPTVWDRKNTAHNVAVGSVREVFGLLRAFQEQANASVDRGKCNPSVKGEAVDYYHCKRVRLMIVGHSFGGLITYNAVSGSLIDSVVRGMLVTPGRGTCKDEFAGSPDAPGGASAMVRSYADLILLINPAIEGVRFEPLHEAVARRAEIEPGQLGAFCPNQRPVLVSITSAYDYATRYAFWAVRGLNTLLESTRPRFAPDAWGRGVDGRLFTDEDYVGNEERSASINALGHVPRYHTHFLRGNKLRAEGKSSAQLGDRPKAQMVERAYADSIKGYCGASPTEGADSLLQLCRCGHKDWWRYVQTVAENPRHRNCPAHIEELNQAEMMSAREIGGGRRLASLYRNKWFEKVEDDAQTEEGTTGKAPAADDKNPPWNPHTARLAGWVQSFCGGAAVQQLEKYEIGERGVPEDFVPLHSPASPVWNVYADDATLIEGHSDLDGIAMQSMFQQLYHAITVRGFWRSSFLRLGEAAGKEVRSCPATLDEARKANAGLK